MKPGAGRTNYPGQMETRRDMADDDNGKDGMKRRNMLLGLVLALAALGMYVSLFIKMS